MDNAHVLLGAPLPDLRDMDHLHFFSDVLELVHPPLKAILYIPPEALINPRLLSSRIRRENVVCSRSLVTPNVSPYIKLFHLSAENAYGIRENWTHVICVLYRDGAHEVYDDFLNDNPFYSESKRLFSEGSLERSRCHRISIWRE